MEYLDLGYKNPIVLTLKENGAPADLSLVTRVVLRFGERVVDTGAAGVTTGAGGNVDWSAGGGVLTLRLGRLASPPPAGEYAVLVELTESPADGPLRFGSFPCKVR